MTTHVVDHDEHFMEAADDSGDGVKAPIGEALPDPAGTLRWVTGAR